MSHEFCEHLGDYAQVWARAEAAYGAMNAAVERILAGGPREDLVDVMDVAVRQWRAEAQTLRARFADCVRRGAIALPEASDDPQAAAEGARCTVCGHHVPRLAWPDWTVTDAGGLSYRGAALQEPQPA